MKPIAREPADPVIAEHLRLAEDAQAVRNWKRWGPYVSERQWGTVREDYSPNGHAWEYLSHDAAMERWPTAVRALITGRYPLTAYADLLRVPLPHQERDGHRRLIPAMRAPPGVRCNQGVARRYASAPPQLDPAPALQPKQWDAVRISPPSRSASRSISCTVSG